MAKMLKLKILTCHTCFGRHKLANYCERAAEKIGPIEMYETIKAGGIHPDCPLPDYVDEDIREDFYSYLRDTHKTIDRAIVWAIYWALEQAPIPGFGEFTLRAMAFHVSSAFEGKSDKWGMSYEAPSISYIDTKYGPRIYEAMASRKDPSESA